MPFYVDNKVSNPTEFASHLLLIATDVGLVKVLLLKDNIDNEKEDLENKIKVNNINNLLTTGTLKNCFKIGRAHV